MKAFSPRPLLSAAVALTAALPAAWAATAEDPVIAGAFTDLRKAPLFQSPALPLAKTWGPALPVGTPFQVEKVYGRWIYGRPTPPSRMKPQDFAPSGWVFSRSLLMPGDTDTLPAPLVRQTRAVLFHARSLGKKQAPSSLDFLEGLTLSRRTLDAFSRPEGDPQARAFSWIPEARAEDAAAQAEEEKVPAPLGLTGADLTFLDQEVHVVKERKKKEAKARDARKLKPPPAPALDDSVRTALLGRFMLERYLELPALSMEEVDGTIYMRATAMRALGGCPAKVQSFWKNRRWGMFRVFRLKSRPEVKHPWFEASLPGGYFAVSGRAIELAANEAELAFLLVRQLVRETRLKRKAAPVSKKGWPENLAAKAEEVWDLVLKSQSTREADNFDVADEIAVDTQAIECISRAGYRPMAAIAYLRKLALNRDASWASWYNQHSIGLDYRIERASALTQESLAQQRFPEGQESREKRFASAHKQWNVLP